MKNPTPKKKMKFVDDKPRPEKKTGGVYDTLKTRDGIYKPVPVASAKKEVPVPPKKEGPKPQKKKPVQFSSQKRAVKHMNKSIKAKQRGGPGSSGARRGFNK